VLIFSACVVYRDRYRTPVVVEPEFWGTVTYVDPVVHRIDLDYIGDRGRHYTRAVYYDERRTQFDGVRYSNLRAGDQVWVRGRNVRGRYRAESIRRH
jgi:hypothetical protein